MVYTLGKGIRKNIKNKITSLGAAFVLTIASLSGVAPILTQTAFAAGATTVTSTSMQGWSAQTVSGGNVTFVNDNTAPDGLGAVEFTTDSTNSSKAGLSMSTDTKLADVSQLSYATKQLSTSFAGGDAAYRLTIDADGNLATTNDTATLVYEPYWQDSGHLGDPAPVTHGSWQSWDVANGVFWASIPSGNSISGLTNGAGGPPFYSLSDLQSLIPNALVTNVSTGIGSYNTNYDVEVDDLSFNGNTYNFEGLPPAAPTNLHMLDNTHNNYAPLAAGVVPNSVNPAAADLVWIAPAGNIDHYIVTTYKDNVQVGQAWVGTPNSWVGFSNGGFGLHGDGSYTFSVVAYDNVGQASAPATSAAYIYDRTSPQITNITYNGAQLTNNKLVSNAQAATIVANVSEANPSRTYVEVDQLVNNKWQKLDGAWSTGSAANAATLVIPAGTLPENTQLQVKVSVDDAAGNHTGSSIPFTVDNTAPTITVKPGYTGDLSSKTFSNVSFSLYDAYQVDKYIINGHVVDFSNNKWSDANFQNIKQYLDEGPNTITLYDVAGNSSSYTFTYDSIAPYHPTNLEINGQNGTFYTKVGSPFTQTWQESVKSKDVVKYNYVSCYVDTMPTGNTCPGGADTYSTTTTAPSKQVNNGDTKHDEIFFWHVQAVDGAGNTSGWSDWSEVVVDSTKPHVSGSTEPGTNPSSFTITATDTVPGSGINRVVGNIYKYDQSQAAYILYAGHSSSTDNPYTIDLSGLADGLYYVRYNANDKSGNISNTEEFSFTVDHTAPAVTITGYGQNGNVIQPTVSVDGSTTPTGYTYSWTTNPNVTISSPDALNPTFTVTRDGSYTFQLTVTDAAGNPTTVPFSFTYTTPVTPQAVNIGSSPSPAFSQVSTTQSNSGGNGAGNNGTTTVALTNNVAGTNTPQVLGASTTNGDSDSGNTGDNGNVGVKGTSTKNVKNSGAFLGLGWWWLLVLILVGLLAYGLGRGVNSTDKKANS